MDRLERVETLRYDVAARTAIDLATGILMEQRGISAEEALALLAQPAGRVADATATEEVAAHHAEESDDVQRLA